MAKNSFKTVVIAAAGSLLAHWAVLQGPIPAVLGDGEIDTDPPLQVLTVTTAPVASTPPRPAAPPAVVPGAAIQPRPQASSLVAQENTAPVLTETVAEVEPERHADPDPAPTIQAAEPPPPAVTRLQFKVYLGEGDGDALAQITHTLKFQDGHYEISSRGEALGLLATLYSGLLTQRSAGSWGVRGFETLQYTEQRGKRPETNVTISPGDLSAQFSNGHVAALASKDAQDRLSVIYHLGQSLRNKPAQRGETRRFQVLSTSGLETYQFSMLGSEVLNYDGHSIDAWHVVRQLTEPGDKTGIEIWYDLQGDGWPVQIRLTDKKGMVITQKRALQGRGSTH